MSDQPSGWGPPSGQGQRSPSRRASPSGPALSGPAVSHRRQYAGQPYPGPYPGPPGYPPAQPPLPTGPAPLDQPQYDASIGQAVVRFWKKYVVFSGRASRSEFWWWFLVSAGVSVVLNLFGNVMFGMRMATTTYGAPTFDLRTLLPAMLPGLIWTVAVVIGTLALGVRRLHDTNRSGWWLLLYLPSLVGLVFYLVGLSSIDMTRLSEGDFGGVAVGALIAGAVFSLLGAVGGIILIVFWVLAPNPAGARFDRPSAGTQPSTTI